MSAEFLSWLTAWLHRHPVQSPPADQQASYTAEVMARVSAPAPATEPAQSSLARKCRTLLSARPTEPAQSSLARKCRPALAGRPFRWVARPRLAWALATVAACGMALMVVQRQPSAAARMAADVQRAVDVLAAVGELDPLGGVELEQDAVLMDQLTLAEAQTEVQDEEWIEETTDLLDALEDDPALEASNGESMEELLHELELLDEHDIASS